MNKYFDILVALISWLNNILSFNQTNGGKDVLTEVLIQGGRTGKTLNRNMAHKLRELIHEGNIKEIEKMVSNNKNILYADMVDHQQKKTNPLIEAVVTGNEKIVKFFLEKDTWLVNQTKPQPPLFYCIDKQKKEEEEEEEENDPKKEPKKENDPKKKKDPIFDILLKHTDLNERFGNSKWTPLMYAIHKKSYEAFRKILEQENLDMKKKDGAGNTALHYAACKDSIYLVLLCYFKTVDFNAKNENGQKANQPLPGVTEKNKEWLKKFEEAGNDKTKKQEVFDQYQFKNRKILKYQAPTVNITVRDVQTMIVNQTNTCRGIDEENNTPVSNDNPTQSRTTNGNGHTSITYDMGRSYPSTDSVPGAKNSTDPPSYEDAIHKRQRSFNQSTLQGKPVELLLPRKNMRDIMKKPIFSL